MILFLARQARDRNGPETRSEILNLLRHEPGLTKTQICHRLKLAWGTVSHHVRVLQREQELVGRRFLGFTRLYTRDTPGPEMVLMPLLRESLVPYLLERLEANPGMGIQALSRELSLGRKVVRRQLEAMVESGLLERTEDYRPRFFVLEKGRNLAGSLEPGKPDPAADRAERDDMSMHV